MLASATAQAERILGDRAAAEDVAAEAVTRVVEGKPEHLLPLIVHGLAVDEYRRRGKEIPAGFLRDDNLELSQGQPLSFEDAEFHADFDTVLRELEEPERDAFILTELRGLTVREAADVLDTSKDTVHRRAERARLTVREELLSD